MSIHQHDDLVHTHTHTLHNVMIVTLKHTHTDNRELVP